MKLLIAKASTREAHMLGADARDAANEPDLTPQDVEEEVRRIEQEARIAADLRYNEQKNCGAVERARVDAAWQQEMRELSLDGRLK